MHASKIADHEARFFNDRSDSNGIQFDLNEQSIRIRGTEEVMHFTKCRRSDGVESYYEDEKNEKTQIVLHHTAGYLKGDLAALTRKDFRVSTTFLIARNGTILNLFPWDRWSYHLGPGAVGGNEPGAKRTVGIELSNIGWLQEVNGKLCSPYSKTDVYCDLSETQYYTELETPYRGKQYFATFTDEQYESLIVVLRFLTNQFDIPNVFLPENERFVLGSNPALPQFKGITSHVNYQASGKWDISPAFDWKRLIEGVQS